MNPITREWVNKAEGDFATARRELQVVANANDENDAREAVQRCEKVRKIMRASLGLPG